MIDIPFTLDQLRILKAIANEGSFKKASERLYVSQPALSLQMQNLERQLNTPLFYRGRRRLQLTETGQLLLRYCGRILTLCEETCRALDDLQSLHGGTLIMGASQTTGTYLMPRLLGLFRKRYPDVSVELQVHSTRPPELKEILQVTAYAEDELALILPTSHPFSQLKYIQKEDLYRLQFITLDPQSTIRKVIDKVLNQNGIDSKRFKIEMELNSIEAIKNAVQSGLGAAFVSVSAISKELELGLLHWAPIEKIMIKRTLSIIINPNRYYSKAAEQFGRDVLSLFSDEDNN